VDPDLEVRLGRIEARLSKLEERAGEGPASRSTAAAGPSPPPAAGAPAPSRVAAPVPAPPAGAKESSVTTILGWSGATALVLSAAYLIRLAVQFGWLTPARQIGIAVLAALGLVAAGFALRRSSRQYASYLPAGGIVILFLCIYGAHLYYHLVGAPAATVSVVAVCVAALALNVAFGNVIYALFAVIGSYSAPFLIHPARAAITDLVVYYTAWSLLFCGYAIGVRRRLVYLLAAYLGLVGFDAVWRAGGGEAWVAALAFQSGQFLIFAAATAYFSVRHRRPMDTDTALAHAPAMVIFYFLQYALLQRHLPAYAPWIAVASALVVLALYVTARVLLRRDPEGGRLLLALYAALVLLHAIYIETVPQHWAPWLAPVLAAAVAVWAFAGGRLRRPDLPLWLALAVIAAANYVQVLSGLRIETVPGHDWLAAAYALELYAGYGFARRRGELEPARVALIYLGHAAALSAGHQLFSGSVAVSVVWGVLALACLGLGVLARDRVLGQSSLFLFAACAGKVLIYDLSGASPLVRIGCLLVLGLPLYAGGWLYR